MDNKIWRRDLPEEGSDLSMVRFAASSHVDPLQILADKAACLATKAAYLVL